MCWDEKIKWDYIEKPRGFALFQVELINNPNHLQILKYFFFIYILGGGGTEFTNEQVSLLEQY